jgi:hypothetical protein
VGARRLDKSESELWSVIEERWSSPGEALAPTGEAIAGDALKDLNREIKKKAKRRAAEVAALL